MSGKQGAFTLWHIPASGEQAAVKLLGEFKARGKAILGAAPHIPDESLLTDCWQRDGLETRLELGGEYGTLLIVEAEPMVSVSA